MTRAVYQSMFLSLSAFLMAVLFAVAPSDTPEVTAFQAELRHEFSKAAVEVIGDYDYSAPFELVWSSVEDFYDEAATQAVALLEPDDGFTGLVLMFDDEYVASVNAASAPMVSSSEKEEAIYNIVPMDDVELVLDPDFSEDLAYIEEYGGIVAGDSIFVGEEPEPEAMWLTISDSITGAPYCVSVFFGTINSYPGACAKETETEIYEN